MLAIAAGKHILVETPLAPTAKEAEEARPSPVERDLNSTGLQTITTSRGTRSPGRLSCGTFLRSGGSGPRASTPGPTGLLGEKRKGQVIELAAKKGVQYMDNTMFMSPSTAPKYRAGTRVAHSEIRTA